MLDLRVVDQRISSLFFFFQNLHLIYEKIEREQNIPLGDFPKIERMQELLRNLVRSSLSLHFHRHLSLTFRILLNSDNWRRN